jgi:hypothetical protein
MDCPLPADCGCENLRCRPYQNLPRLKSALGKEREAQHIVEQTIDTEYQVLDSRQAWDPGLGVNGMGIATAKAVSPDGHLRKT